MRVTTLLGKKKKFFGDPRESIERIEEKLRPTKFLRSMVGIELILVGLRFFSLQRFSLVDLHHSCGGAHRNKVILLGHYKASLDQNNFVRRRTTALMSICLDTIASYT